MDVNGAGTVSSRSKTVKLPDGSHIELSVLALADYAQLKEQACDDYKRNLIKTWTKNLDLLPAENRAEAVQKAFERAELITPDTLPKKMAWMPEIDKSGKPVVNLGEPFIHEGTGALIETGGPILVQREIDYVSWWMSQTHDGRLYTSWLSMRRSKQHKDITFDQVMELFESQLGTVSMIADEIGDLSAPRVGND